ncbi:hypothetical protein ACFLY6_03220 [Candidatus Dependentiae bacterium]
MKKLFIKSLTVLCLTMTMSLKSANQQHLNSIFLNWKKAPEEICHEVLKYLFEPQNSKQMVELITYCMRNNQSFNRKTQVCFVNSKGKNQLLQPWFGVVTLLKFALNTEPRCYPENFCLDISSTDERFRKRCEEISCHENRVNLKPYHVKTHASTTIKLRIKCYPFYLKILVIIAKDSTPNFMEISLQNKSSSKKIPEIIATGPNLYELLENSTLLNQNF